MTRWMRGLYKAWHELDDRDQVSSTDFVRLWVHEALGQSF